MRHIGLELGDMLPKVIVCGDPERARILSSMATEARPLAKRREYHSYRVKMESEELLVISHGVGAAGAVICFEELCQLGAKVIVRLGTAGGLYAGAKPGDVLVPMAAVREDGVSPLMIPLGYPAVSDPDLSQHLRRGLSRAAIDHQSGIVLSSDLYYPKALGSSLKLYQSAKVLAVEMEVGSLFVTGSLNGVKTAAVLVIDGNPLEWQAGNYDAETASHKTLAVGQKLYSMLVDFKG